MARETDSAHSERLPWLVCNCADTPPTMPTCRAEHLPTCPMMLYGLVCKLEAQAEEARRACPPPERDQHGRPKPDVERMLHASSALSYRLVRAVMEGVPIHG